MVSVMKMLAVVTLLLRTVAKTFKKIGLAPPKFTCVPVAENKELKLLVPEQQGSRFPF